MPRQPKLKILDVWPLGNSHIGYTFKDRKSNYKWNDYTKLKITRK